MKNHSNAGQIFREITQALFYSKYIAIGSFIRKPRSRKDARMVTKTGARKVAEAFYNLLVKGAQYVEQGIAKYERKLKEREQRRLQKLASKHGMKIIEPTIYTTCHWHSYRNRLPPLFRQHLFLKSKLYTNAF